MHASLFGQSPRGTNGIYEIPISTRLNAFKKKRPPSYKASDSEFPLGIFLGYWNGNPTRNNASTFSGTAGAIIGAEYQIQYTNIILSLEAMAGTTGSYTRDIIFMDGNNPVNTEMNILNNSNIIRFGLTYKVFNSKMISPLIFANAGRMGSRTLLTIQRPNPGEDEPRQYVNKADIHKDSALGYGFGVGLRFEFSRLYAVSAEPIGMWNTRPIEYMNANASIRPDIEAGTPEQYADILAPNYQYEGDYYTDYIYKTPMDMLYFSISLGIRFGGASFR